MDWLKNFPPESRDFWKYTAEEIKDIQEIRIRAHRPVILYRNTEEYYLNLQGRLTTGIEEGIVFSYEKIQRLVDYWCMDSRYAYQNQLKEGYLTLRGGHRIGICGEVVIKEGNYAETIKNISGLNLRIAHEKKEAGTKLIGHLYREGELQNTLLIAPPGCGKTTLLRDLVRRISNGSEAGKGRNVGLVDERGEIAACFQGVPQLDIGLRTDVLTSCPKRIGMLTLLRSMGPQVIAVDELGGEEDVCSLRQIIGCGCTVLATVHGRSIEELKQKKGIGDLIKENVFSRFVIQKKEGRFFRIQLYGAGEEPVCCIS